MDGERGPGAGPSTFLGKVFKVRYKSVVRGDHWRDGESICKKFLGAVSVCPGRSLGLWHRPSAMPGACCRIYRVVVSRAATEQT